ncbi:MAG TPA: ankyrin repeat domain-containing protein [Acidimicrobiales bacterium]|nr:ankyrin repeat domain-containing protein [Acidimicrobiales bacterium]
MLTIRGGDIAELSALLAQDPGMATARLVGKDGGSRTALHVVTDWPGYFPRGPQSARLLLSAGADPDERTTGRGGQSGEGTETPLHWAASSDDAEVAAVLIDGGADIEAPRGSIGTPLANAVGYACWSVGRLLVERGARVEALWQAAALGLTGRLVELVEERTPLDSDEVSQAFWHACAGGQRRTADFLLEMGADINWVPDYAQGTPLDAARGEGTQRENVISWLLESGAQSGQDGR